MFKTVLLLSLLYFILCSTQNITADQIVSITVINSGILSASIFKYNFDRYSNTLKSIIIGNEMLSKPKNITLFCVKTNSNNELIHGTIHIIYKDSQNAMELFNYIRDHNLPEINDIIIKCLAYSTYFDYSCEIPNNAIFLTQQTLFPITTNMDILSNENSNNNDNNEDTLGKGKCLHYEYDTWLHHLKWSFDQFWYIYVILGSVSFIVGAIACALLQMIWNCCVDSQYKYTNDKDIIKQSIQGNDNKLFSQIKLDQNIHTQLKKYNKDNIILINLDNHNQPSNSKSKSKSRKSVSRSNSVPNLPPIIVLKNRDPKAIAKKKPKPKPKPKPIFNRKHSKSKVESTSVVDKSSVSGYSNGIVSPVPQTSQLRHYKERSKLEPIKGMDNIEQDGI